MAFWVALTRLVFLQSKMARWPKEQPSTWFSRYKRGSLVSGDASGTFRLHAQSVPATPASRFWPKTDLTLHAGLISLVRALGVGGVGFFCPFRA